MSQAIVHEWIDSYAGSEQVFEAMANVYPDADLFALSLRDGVDLNVGDRAIETTFLNHRYLRDRRGITLPLMPLAWQQLGRRNYDLVLTSHHAFAQANRLVDPVHGTHLVYVHTPARYVWNPELDARGASRMLAPVRHALRAIDRRASLGVHAYAANSRAVADRVKQHWHRECTVIAPPVRVEYFGERSDLPATRDYVLGVGRWVSYKNLDLVVEVGDKVGLPVKIAGRGEDKARIVAAAEVARIPVQLIESPSDEVLRGLYRNAAVLVFPTVDDFGIVPVEAQAAGTPVVAPRRGGALDTVLDGVTGILTADLDPVSMAEAAVAAMGLSEAACREHSNEFSRARFKERLVAWVSDQTRSTTSREK